MEKRISVKVNEYQENFKSKIKVWLEKKEIDIKLKSELMQLIYDFESLNLSKEDFSKRKRVKSHVPHYLRCNACRANGEQCTRKKKDGSYYCGTHDKNRPHGEFEESEKKEVKLTKDYVWTEEINGILYYIDNKRNIYKTEEIITNQMNPSIIGRYKCEDGIYKLDM